LGAGGMMLVVARCGEGAGQPELLRWFDHRDRAAHVRALHATFSVPGQTGLAPREHAERAEVYLYSTLPPDIVARIGVRPVDSVVDFFAAVARRYGDDVEGYALAGGACYLPVAAAAA